MATSGLRCDVGKSRTGLGTGVFCRMQTVEAPVAPSVAAHARGRADRRKPQSLFARQVWFGGRRVAARRASEREGAIVDSHGPLLLVMALAIVTLNLLDAWFTMLFLSYGGRELNPMVDMLLQMGHHPWPFIILKTLGIGIAVVLLALAKNFRSARFGLALVLLGYTVLLGWHLYLYTHLDSAG
ncbi:MAG: hypothetical protein RL398_807 [Planctomycetota bacterium]